MKLKQYRGNLFESFRRTVATKDISMTKAKMIVWISQAQIISYYFDLNFEWYLSTLFTFPQFIIQFLRVIPLLWSDSFWILYIFWALSILNFILTLTLFTFETEGDLFRWLLKQFNGMQNIFIWILFAPITEAFISTFSCETNLMKGTECNSTAHIVFIGLSSFCLLLSVL